MEKLTDVIELIKKSNNGLYSDFKLYIHYDGVINRYWFDGLPQHYVKRDWKSITWKPSMKDKEVRVYLNE